jgi:hypothetical protein
MARHINPGGVDAVRRVPVGVGFRWRGDGVHVARVGRHAGDTVHQWRAVSDPGGLGFRNFGNPYPVLLLSIWIGVSLLVQGFSIVAVAISYKALPARGWYGVVGVLSVIAGAVVLVWPWDSIAVLTLATGVWLVVMGIVEIVQGFQMRNDSKTVREVGNVVRERFGEAKQAS